MKKKVLVILLIIVSLFLFVACDGRGDEIIVGCIVDEDRIELPIKTKDIFSHGTGTDFYTALSLEEVDDIINGIQDDYAKISTEIFNNFILITKVTNADDMKHFYLIIQKGETEDKFMYELTTPSGSIDSEIIYVPIHLLSWEDDIYKYYSVRVDKEYKLTADLKTFIDFYKDIDIYDIEVTDKLITMRVKEDAYISSGYVRHTRQPFEIAIKSGKESVSVTYHSIAE